jgi:hypothetical protein
VAAYRSFAGIYDVVAASCRVTSEHVTDKIVVTLSGVLLTYVAAEQLEQALFKTHCPVHAALYPNALA